MLKTLLVVLIGVTTVSSSCWQNCADDLFCSLWNGQLNCRADAIGCCYEDSATSTACPLSGRQTAQAFVDLKNSGPYPTCGWYDSNSCCRTEIAAAFGYTLFSSSDSIFDESVDFCGVDKVENKCLEKINLLICMPCDPDQSMYTTTSRYVTLCNSFVEELYESCKTSSLTSDCKNVEDLYPNLESFKSIHMLSNFDFGDDNCFSGTTSTGSFFFWIF